MPASASCRALGLPVLLALGACAAPGPPIPVTTGSLLDDYELVSGMAEGRVLGSLMTRGQVLRLVELDRAAREALIAAASDPSSASARNRARDAIRALADDAAAPTATGATLVVTARRSALPPPPAPPQ